MSILSELKQIALRLELPVQTGSFQKKPPDVFLVLTPMTETFPEHADNTPQFTQPEVRLSLYAKGSYTRLTDTLVRCLLQADFTVTGRQYIEYETDTGYHHYEIDVTKAYPFILNEPANKKSSQIEESAEN